MRVAQEARKELMTQGATIVKSFLTPAQLDQIDRELEPWLAQIAWSDVMGYALRFGDKWLDHLGLCSPTLIRVVLDEEMLDFAASVFGEEPILAEFALHASTSPNPELAFHSDIDGGIVFYVFLSEMNESNGLLSFIPGTQFQAVEEQFIPSEEIEKRRAEIVPLPVERGDALFFDQDVWHRRGPGGPGRKVVRVIYHPAGRTDGAIDHLYRQSYLAGLSERQLHCFGIGHEPFKRIGYFRHLGRDFRRSDIRDLLVYLRRFRKLALRRARPQPAAAPTQAEARVRPPRKRAEL